MKDATRIARLLGCQRRLLNDLAFSASYRGSCASEDALRLCLQQRLVEQIGHDENGRPHVRLTSLGARIQRKAKAQANAGATRHQGFDRNGNPTTITVPRS